MRRVHAVLLGRGFVPLLAALAAAQGSSAEASEPAASSAAMQRAERLASSPLRAILEASRIQRRTPAASAAPLPAVPAGTAARAPAPTSTQAAAAAEAPPAAGPLPHEAVLTASGVLAKPAPVAQPALVLQAFPELTPTASSGAPAATLAPPLESPVQPPL